jgi:hypothetical protein
LVSATSTASAHDKHISETGIRDCQSAANGPGDRINVLLGTLVNAKCCAVNDQYVISRMREGVVARYFAEVVW